MCAFEEAGGAEGNWNVLPNADKVDGTGGTNEDAEVGGSWVLGWASYTGIGFANEKGKETIGGSLAFVESCSIGGIYRHV